MALPPVVLYKEIVKQFKQKPPVLTPDDWHVGDIFTLNLEGKDKKYNGCWAVVLEVTDCTVMVDVHDATLSVKPENLHKQVDGLKARQQVPQILQRIRRLREVGFLDRGANNVLEDLGKHTDLTSVEEGLLSWLEKYYQIDEQDIESDS